MPTLELIAQVELLKNENAKLISKGLAMSRSLVNSYEEIIKLIEENAALKAKLQRIKDEYTNLYDEYQKTI